MRGFLLLLSICVVYSYAEGGMDFSALTGQGKKFFADMTKKAMGVPSLKPENIAAQSFFRTFLDKYTKLDDKVKTDMMQHVPTATKLFNQAAEKYNVNPTEAFQMLSTFFQGVKKQSQSGIAKQGMKLAGSLFGKKNN